MKTSTTRASLLAAVAALALTGGAGCASTVTFAVVRPALMNLSPSGNTISVGQIQPNGQPEAAADVAADLQQRIAGSLNPSIRLLPDGAGVTVDGSIVEDSYEQHYETVSQTCTRTVDDGTDSNGNAQSHTESYDCSYDILVGNATSQIRLRVVEGGGAHRVIFDQGYTQTARVNSPNALDVQKVRHGVRDLSVEQFAKVILPWQDIVTERFKDCDGETLCKQGFAATKKGDLVTADGLFSQVIGGYANGAVVPSTLTKRIGEAYYDRAVVRAHQERYEEAVSDMQVAIKLQPKRPKWPNEMESVKQMARDKMALRAQGATP
jgi:hypothetical protein